MLNKIIYWVATGLLAFAYAAGGYFDIAQPEDVVKGSVKLGYPLFFFTILGCWKLAAVVAILSPGLLRVKEWAYAGIMFNLTSAVATHAFVHDSMGEIMTPLIVLAIAIASWAFRPASRKLPGPWL